MRLLKLLADSSTNIAGEWHGVDSMNGWCAGGSV